MRWIGRFSFLIVFAVLLCSLPPNVQAAGTAKVDLQLLHYTPSSGATSLLFDIHNPSQQPKSFYGYLELTSNHSRQLLRFDANLRFGQGTRSFELKGPRLLLSAQDQLLVGVRLYDQETGELAYTSPKYNTQIPQLDRSMHQITLLLQAEQQQMLHLLDRKSKRLDPVLQRLSKRKSRFVWLLDGQSKTWGNPLIRALNLKPGSIAPLKAPLELATKSALDPRSLAGRVFLKERGTGRFLKVQTEVKPGRLIIKPAAPFPPEQDFQLVLGRGIRSRSGTTLEHAFYWSFRSDQAELLPFELAESSPLHEANSVPVSGGIRLLFTNSPDPKSFETNSVQLFKGEDEQVFGRLRLKGNQLKFTPKKPLQHNQTYRMVISGLQDKAGQSLVSAYQIVFTTEAAKAQAQVLAIKSMYPPPKTKGVNVDEKIWIEFKDKLDPLSVETGVQLVVGDAVVAGRWALDGARVEFTPDKPLGYGQIYQVKLLESLNGAKGQHLRKPLSWPFKTRKDMGYPKEQDPNVLVFSPSHEEISYVQVKTGVLKVEVTAFDPILQVDVNGKRFEVKKDTKATIELPYTLKARTTKFQVSVVTEKGLGQKTFVVNYGNKGDGPSFMLITILSRQSLDNIDKVAATGTKKKATKSTVIMVPQFTYRLSPKHALGIKGLVLREKYADKVYLSREAAFNQLAFDWTWKGSFVGKLVTKVGWNDIRTDNSKLSNGKVRLLSETFFGISAQQKWGKKTSLTTALEGKNSNAIAKAASIDNETDAVVSTLDIKAKTDFFGVSTQLVLQGISTQAVGKYKDTSASKGGLKFSGKLWGTSPSLYVFQKTTEYKIYNPTVSAKQKNVDQQGELKLSYPLVKGLNLGVEYKHKTSTSNVGVAKYTLGTAGINLTHIW